MINIKRTEIEEHRESWATVAKQNGWYKPPFYVQVWIDDDGNVVNSVSMRGLKKDLIVSSDTDKILKPNTFTIN